MKLLALECSATAASVALCTRDKVIGEYFLSTGQTHSQTLLPMTEQLLHTSGETLAGVELLAVSVGPGSFTGLRIGISAVKGIAMGANKPCVAVSTLEALAYNLCGFEGIAASVMDARCGQVYCALFHLEDGRVSRICPDSAMTIADLGKILGEEKKPVFLVGDGAMLCYNILLENVPGLRLAPPHLRLQRAASVGACAWQQYERQGAVSAAALAPTYLRLPQAERELKRKEATGGSAS
ncbi:MAG: tRNA (adenosine(37)-N6)-threonylcarbamoyltransferase complex dimerization subunit type 1 TsaB [Angelakisella sp.]|nr:tRNA (adenosine(37)-N6)-threonylcarbamoyltransferase complex dimerization subunit type 1 TsaB [Angelakisella sp.]